MIKDDSEGDTAVEQTATPQLSQGQAPTPHSTQQGRLLLALAVLVSASSSSSSELSELLMGSDTRDCLACSDASSFAFCFWPSSEVL